MYTGKESEKHQRHCGTGRRLPPPTPHPPRPPRTDLANNDVISSLKNHLPIYPLTPHLSPIYPATPHMSYRVSERLDLLLHMRREQHIQRLY